eukprot:1159474-Pelagomonas_calceolata.AAC.3
MGCMGTPGNEGGKDEHGYKVSWDLAADLHDACLSSLNDAAGDAVRSWGARGVAYDGSRTATTGLLLCLVMACCDAVGCILPPQFLAACWRCLSAVAMGLRRTKPGLPCSAWPRCSCYPRRQHPKRVAGGCFRERYLRGSGAWGGNMGQHPRWQGSGRLWSCPAKASKHLFKNCETAQLSWVVSKPRRNRKKKEGAAEHEPQGCCTKEGLGHQAQGCLSAVTACLWITLEFSFKTSILPALGGVHCLVRWWAQDRQVRAEMPKRRALIMHTRIHNMFRLENAHARRCVLPGILNQAQATHCVDAGEGAVDAN